MIATFEVPQEAYYIAQHDRFMLKVMVQMSVSEIDGIKYQGTIPALAERVKFSDFLNIMGCVPIGDGFLGYFGQKSYKDVLQQFICETCAEHGGTLYYIDIDVPKYSQTKESADADLCFCIENIINRNKKLAEAE